MPDGSQLPLPAMWARRSGNYWMGDPVALRRKLDRDVLDTKAAIRTLLDGFAERHPISAKEVSNAMNYVDDALADLVYEIVGELNAEAERRDPIE